METLVESCGRVKDRLQPRELAGLFHAVVSLHEISISFSLEQKKCFSSSNLAQSANVASPDFTESGNVVGSEGQVGANDDKYKSGSRRVDVLNS